ncbi:hypothetical protein SLEP1_g13963 [Rubroshorea leprosula]|uniref:Uncharacterized protein n=1 Tax=Rubroshorea leprosula TaxID=152421 RepID=A0AAV5INH5_9ROSI|nr:hypothetical protein SLEP1_g13963 [Rubroshorea leprosula]
MPTSIGWDCGGLKLSLQRHNEGQQQYDRVFPKDISSP